MAKQMNSSNKTPTHEQIARRAEEIFVERGRPEGRDIDHWLAAEAELMAAAQSGGQIQRASAPAQQSAAAASLHESQSNGRSQGNGRTQTRARK